MYFKLKSCASFCLQSPLFPPARPTHLISVQICCTLIYACTKDTAITLLYINFDNNFAMWGTRTNLNPSIVSHTWRDAKKCLLSKFCPNMPAWHHYLPKLARVTSLLRLTPPHILITSPSLTLIVWILITSPSLTLKNPGRTASILLLPLHNYWLSFLPKQTNAIYVYDLQWICMWFSRVPRMTSQNLLVSDSLWPRKWSTKSAFLPTLNCHKNWRIWRNSFWFSAKY
jgi:hypothetical protein